MSFNLLHQAPQPERYILTVDDNVIAKAYASTNGITTDKWAIELSPSSDDRRVLYVDNRRDAHHLLLWIGKQLGGDQG